MGLFSRVVGGSKGYPNTESEAVLGILLAIIAADGDISDDEHESFMYLANKTKSLGPMPAAEFKEHVHTCLALVRRNGAPSLMSQCAPMIGDGRRAPLFINACDLIMRDGRVDPDEERLIEELQAKLGLDDEFAANAATLILSKYSL